MVLPRPRSNTFSHTEAIVREGDPAPPLVDMTNGGATVDDLLGGQFRRQLAARETGEHLRLSHRHGTPVHRDPSPSLKGPQGGVDALPGARGVMGELLLGQV